MLDVVEMNYLTRNTLELVAAPSKASSDEIPVKYAFGVINE